MKRIPKIIENHNFLCMEGLIPYLHEVSDPTPAGGGVFYCTYSENRKVMSQIIQNRTFLCEENHVFSDSGDFPGCPPVIILWYFPVKCEIWRKIVQNHTFLCEENHVFLDPGIFRDPPPVNFREGQSPPKFGGRIFTPRARGKIVRILGR